MRKLRIDSRLLFVLVLLAGAAPAQGGNTDPNAIWPLCGRISESPPAGWIDTDGCPASRFGDPNYSDEPLNSTFGPRPLASEGNRYDFHRGVDIATPIGTPFFAISDGTVEIAGAHPSYSDPLVKLRHFRPGENSCTAEGCYHSFYLHIDSWVVAENDAVVKGQLLGYTGASASGFEHVHFEVRDAPDFDAYSAWSRDAIHPLSAVPYQAANNTSIVFNDVDLSHATASRVDLTVTSNRYDLVSVELVLLDSGQQTVAQSGNTPNANGYYVEPPFFDMEAWNFLYSHKNSTSYPWSSYGTGGANECPYHADHGASYNANVHMDQPHPGDDHEGLFNGVHIRTSHYWPSDVSDYAVDLEFLALEGPAACVEATAVFASGDTASAQAGSCGAAAPNQDPTAIIHWNCRDLSCDFDGTGSSDPDGSIVSYDWDFGDGNLDSGASVSHTFAIANAYSVTLTVTDDSAGTGNDSQTVTVPLVLRGPYLQMQTDDGITIHWRTAISTDSVVRYGSSPGSLTGTVTAAGSTTEHEVALSGLGANQHYWYSVGDSIETMGSGPTNHFYTAPVQGSAADTRIWVIGDSGTANQNARNVRDAYKAWTSSNPANLWLMLGDNAYNDGTDAEYQAAVFETYPEILRQLPLWATLGNHDGHTADSSTQSGPYYDIFNLPTGAEIGGLASGTEAYYSFDYANIHFICLDSYETDRSPAGAMMTWLESDLMLNTQSWVVAIWHHPPYTKGSHNSDTEGRLIDMRTIALPILEAWGVDLVMTGHSHSYERSYLLDSHYGGSTTLDPVLNVLDPGDGSETNDGYYEKPDTIQAQHAGAVYAVAGSSGKISGGALNHPAMFISLNSLGSLVLDVSGNRLDGYFIDDTGALQDEFSIVKTPDSEPPLISGAAGVDATHVEVDFNEALHSTEATDPANFTIEGLGVSQAELLAGNRRVRLTTTTMNDGSSHTLVVNNVEDLLGNVILAGSSIEFDYHELHTDVFQDGLLPDPGYNGTFDAYIRQATATTAYGAAVDLEVDGDEPSGSGQDMSIVLGWDISSIPTDATVESAEIYLENTNRGGPYTCYSLLSPWVEAEVTWNNASNGVPWASPGASSPSERGSDALCTVDADSTGPLTVPLTADGVALVQSWVSDPASNHGIIIADPSTSNGADFHSSESATAMARPKLTVTYYVPGSLWEENEEPRASFKADCAGQDCRFNSLSRDGDGFLTGWSWDFGDGSWSAEEHPAHAYSSPGSYRVTLTVFDDDGAADSVSAKIQVGGSQAQIVLAAKTFTINGVQYVDLAWEGVPAESADIVRDGIVIETVPAAPGIYSDDPGGASRTGHVYRVCAAGTSICSNEVTVRF